MNPRQQAIHVFKTKNDNTQFFPYSETAIAEAVSARIRETSSPKWLINTAQTRIMHVYDVCFFMQACSQFCLQWKIWFLIAGADIWPRYIQFEWVRHESSHISLNACVWSAINVNKGQVKKKNKTDCSIEMNTASALGLLCVQCASIIWIRQPFHMLRSDRIISSIVACSICHLA